MHGNTELHKQREEDVPPPAYSIPQDPTQRSLVFNCDREYPGDIRVTFKVQLDHSYVIIWSFLLWVLTH